MRTQNTTNKRSGIAFVRNAIKNKKQYMMEEIKKKLNIIDAKLDILISNLKIARYNLDEGINKAFQVGSEGELGSEQSEK